MKTRHLYLGIPGWALLCAACGAAAPTPELMTARNAYASARNGEAAQLNPKGVHEAYKALQAAEAAHADDGGSKKERNYAYIATRRSELAVAQASEALAKKEQERAEQTYKADLERHSEQMQQESVQVAAQSSQYAQQLQATTQTLEERERKLAEAQRTAERAQQELRQMESMREEAGRLVISLSGVLFESGGDKLSSLAERRLDTVAQALAAYPDRQILVEGYTDAQGDEAKNRDLSQKRADSAREYLERRGVPGERIRSVGRGEDNPVASNDTAEGRANNRRVEIIVQPPTGQQQKPDASSRSGPSTSTSPGTGAETSMPPTRTPAQSAPVQSDGSSVEKR